MKKIIIFIMILIPIILFAWRINITIEGTLASDANLGQLKVQFENDMNLVLDNANYDFEIVSVNTDSLDCKLFISGEKSNINNFDETVNNYFYDKFINFYLTIEYTKTYIK